MSLSDILQVVIGLSFLYASLSLIASGANELISSVLALRARSLEKGIRNLLDDPAASAEIYEHPLIRSLFRARRIPSYIPSSKFALALLDT